VYKIRAEATKWPHNARVPEVAIRNVERLLKKLEGLHEPEVYGTLPRLFLVHPTIWLTDTYRAKRNWAKTAKYAMEVLRNFGFVNPLRDGRLVLDYGDKGGIVNGETLNALQYAMEAYRMLGKAGLAADGEGEVKRMFTVIKGSSAGIEEALKVGGV